MHSQVSFMKHSIKTEYDTPDTFYVIKNPSSKDLYMECWNF